jgi:hypothetical protein
MDAKEIYNKLKERDILCRYDVIEAMKHYAKSKCAEQRELCANNAKMTSNKLGVGINYDSIRNAPQPDFN